MDDDKRTHAEKTACIHTPTHFQRFNSFNLNFKLAVSAGAIFFLHILLFSFTATLVFNCSIAVKAQSPTHLLLDTLMWNGRRWKPLSLSLSFALSCRIFMHQIYILCFISVMTYFPTHTISCVRWMYLCTFFVVCFLVCLLRSLVVYT